MSVLFCTTNQHKIIQAQVALKKHGISIEQLSIDVDEVQSADPNYIIEHKAQSMFAKVGKPLIVSDDSWRIPALNGFPGAYMKHVNHWFSPKDWIAIMEQHDDKRIFLERRLAYTDGTDITLFEDVEERQFLESYSAKDGGRIYPTRDCSTR